MDYSEVKYLKVGFLRDALLNLYIVRCMTKPNVLVMVNNRNYGQYRRYVEIEATFLILLRNLRISLHITAAKKGPGL